GGRGKGGAALSGGEGGAQGRRDRQFQFRLGPHHRRRSRSLLREQMGHRRLDSGVGSRITASDGGDPARSGRDRHRHAAKLFRRQRPPLSQSQTVGRQGGAFHPGLQLTRQRENAQRENLARDYPKGALSTKKNSRWPLPARGDSPTRPPPSHYLEMCCGKSTTT